jgi:hypothetical protein
MLVINKGQTKFWYLTLTEKASAASYVFTFTHRQTETVVTRTLTDVSTQTERYNKFQFIEGTTATLLEGEHEYSVSTSGGTLCEIGILKVETTSSVTQYTPTLIEKIHTI